MESKIIKEGAARGPGEGRSSWASRFEVPTRNLALTALGVGLVLALVAPGGGYELDLLSWVRWTAGIRANGLGHAYEIPYLNYPPGLLAILAAMGKLLPASLPYHPAVKAFKLVGIAFDVTSLYGLMLLLRRFRLNPYLALVLINPGFLFDSVGWGQFDGALACLGGASVLAALARRPALSAVLLSLCVSIKLQGIVFVPLVLFLLWPAVRERPTRLVEVGAGLTVPWIVLCVPFVRAGALGEMRASLLGDGSMYPFLHMNAYNPWYVLARSREIHDSMRILGLAAKTWGFLLYGASMVGILTALGVDRPSGDPTGIRTARALTTAGLSAMAFFLLLTEMHERYMHPAMLFLVASGLLTRRYAPAAIVTVGVLVNEGLIFMVSKDWVRDHTPPVVVVGSLVAVAFCVAFALEFRWLARTRKTGADDRSESPPSLQTLTNS